MKTEQKIFNSPQGWFTLNLPQDWAEYDDGEEGTCAFFNTSKWTGNLRLTPIKLENDVKFPERSLANLIQEDLNQHPEAQKIKLKDFDCSHYKKDVQKENDISVIYYWTFGKDDILIVSSFTIDKKQELTKDNKVILNTVREILESVKIN